MSGIDGIERGIQQPKPDPGHPKIADTVQYRPGGIVAAESGFRLLFMQEVVHVDILCLYRHRPDIFKEMRGMGVFLRVTVGMMHTVQNGVSPWIQERRALGNKG